MKQGSILSFVQRQPAQSKSASTIAIEAVSKSESGSVQEGEPLPPINVNVLVPECSGQQTRDPRISIGKVYPSQIGAIKNMTITLLPVRYTDKFFEECLTNDPSIVCGVATFDAKPVAWIRGRIEPSPSAGNHVSDQVYVQALGVLAPYRSLGLATDLLTYLTESVMSRNFALQSIYAHVWEKNVSGLEWYEKRGFKRVMLQTHYYRKLRPSGAWIVRKYLPD